MVYKLYLRTANKKRGYLIYCRLKRDKLLSGHKVAWSSHMITFTWFYYHSILELIILISYVRLVHLKYSYLAQIFVSENDV